jgi:hypothetical protein
MFLRARVRPYYETAQPAIDYVRAHLPQNGVVFATGGLIFDFDFDPRFLDDYLLGDNGEYRVYARSPD